MTFPENGFPNLNRFEMLVQSMLAPIAAIDLDGRQSYVNPAFCGMVGWSGPELLGQSPPFLYWPPEEIETIEGYFREALRGESAKTGFEIRLCRKSGERFIALVLPAPIQDDRKNTVGWVAHVQDISHLKQTEAALREREAFIGSIASAAPEFIYVYDILTQKSVYSNRDVTEALGYSKAEISQHGTNALAYLMHPEDYQLLPERMARWATTEPGEVLETEYRLLSAKGEYRWFLGRDSVFKRDADGSVIQLIGAAKDITDRKRTEAARQRAEFELRESERRYRLLADYSTDLITREDRNGVFLYLSPASIRLIGYPPMELLGRSKYEIVHPSDRDLVFQFHLKLLETRQPGTLTYRLRAKWGEFVWCEARAQPTIDPLRHQVVEIIGVWRDVTDRIATEEALQESEELFRTLVERGHDGIVMLDGVGNIRYMSPSAERILGYSTEEAAELNFLDRLEPEDWQKIRMLLKRDLASPGGTANSQVRARHRDGSWRHIDFVVTNHLTDPYIRAYVLNFRDISDRIDLEVQLRQAQKMEAIGQLAGGIAHDFNNILTAIIGNVCLLLETTPIGEPNRATLVNVDRAARRAAELTSRLLGYSRRTTLHLKATNLNRVVEETLGLLRPTIDPRILFEWNLPTDLWQVTADADQISQVVTNLCLNARDAMSRGGELRVETANTSIDADYARSFVFAQEGDFVRLSVIDTGSGMPPEVRVRVFEPFFTTKSTGQGTGLGLAMVYGIIKAHGGWVTCDSTVGAGSRFDIYLPRTNEPVEDPAKITPIPKPQPVSNGFSGKTILLVDDEPSLRTLGRFILEQNGYRVILAEDGLDALERFQLQTGNIALVILDLTMPRLSGQDTFRRLRELSPEIPVLFCSGYSSELLGDVGEGVGFLSKPYRPADLLESVRLALSR